MVPNAYYGLAPGHAVMLMTMALGANADATHCADADGRIVGLASDNLFTIKSGFNAAPRHSALAHGDKPESWKIRNDIDGPIVNSFTGSYAVVPDPPDAQPHSPSASHHVNSTESFEYLEALGAVDVV